MNAEDLDRLRQLEPQFGMSFQRGDTIFSQGEPSYELYIVLSGRVLLTEGEAGKTLRKGLTILAPEDFFGELSAFTERPRSATARAVEDVTLLKIPPEELSNFVQANPSYAVWLLSELCRRLSGEAETSINESESVIAATDTRSGPLNSDWFYTVKTTCPVCQGTFAAVHVRTKAVQSVKRESDFHYQYKTVNPLHYAIQVCPFCYYTAYADDFSSLSRSESKALKAEGEGRKLDCLGCDFRGERDLKAVSHSLRLALHCYDVRKADERRRAGLLHRLAWAAREAGEKSEELSYLEAAYTSYQKSYEEDSSISESSAVTLAYLLGDLSLRLSRYEEAVRWFNITTRLPEAKRHPEIMRLARDRWAQARDLMRQARERSA